MDAGACGRGREAEAEHHGGAGEAIGHADGAVDELSREAHRHEQDEVVPHQPFSFLFSASRDADKDVCCASRRLQLVGGDEKIRDGLCASLMHGVQAATILRIRKPGMGGEERLDLGLDRLQQHPPGTFLQHRQQWVVGELATHQFTHTLHKGGGGTSCCKQA